MPAPTHDRRHRRPLRFVDLFCGIGGFRIAFEKTGARCVFSSDWNKHSQTAYPNFGERPHGDIHTVTDKLWAYLQSYAKKHQHAGNDFGLGLDTAADTQAYRAVRELGRSLAKLKRIGPVTPDRATLHT